MIASLRALLALVLLGGLYLLVFLMTVIWVLYAGLSVWVLGSHGSGAHFNTQPALTAAATFVALRMILRAVGQISRPAGPHADSVRVDVSDMPQLWAAVHRLAEQVGTTPPAEIRLTPEVNASVTDDSWLLGLRPGYRRLYLGAPLLVGLRPAELRAVLAHELGHYARRHARFTEPAYRGCTALAQARQQIQEAMLASGAIRMYAGVLELTVAGYAAVFNRLTLPIRRRQELEADHIAAQVAGPEALTSALCAVPVLTVAWAEFEREFVDPLRKAGCSPDDPFHAFATMLEHPDCQDRLAELRRLAAEQPADRRDSHPSIATRLDRLSEPAGDAVHADDSDGLAGASDGHAAGKLLQRVASRPRRRGRRLPWREWVSLAAEHRATATLEPLGRAVDTVTGRQRAAAAGAPSLQAVLGLIDAGKATELARALAPELPPTPEGGWQARSQLVAATCTLAAQAVVRSGSAYWTTSLIGPSRLVAAATTTEQIETWVATAIDDPAQVSWLRLQLAAIGVDETAAVTPGPALRGSNTPDPPPLDDGVRQRRRSTVYTTLGIMIGLLTVGGLVWLGTDDPPPPYSRLPASRLTYQPPLPTGIYRYPSPIYPYPLPTGIYRLPTGILPPPRLPPLPSGLVPRP